jgi:dsRNA-specific ribonuclease
MPDWQKQKLEQQRAKEAEIDCFIAYSFRKDFRINNRDLDLYEPSKILGDVFEALIGAVFVDGLMENVIKVYEHMLAPFILYVAKFSKRLNKEPKEDFLILSGIHNLRPAFKDAIPVEIQLDET